MSSRDADLEIVRAAVTRLGEHFDTVQVFVTRVSDEPDDDHGTINVQLGSGNWFARAGQVKEWMVKEDERSRIGVRKSEGGES